MSSNVLNVDSGSDDFNVRHGKLSALSHDTPIYSNHGAAIIIETIAITSLLIGI
jgi:hypothetical protein